MTWKSIGCAVQGRGHKKSDVPCQDVVHYDAVSGVHVIALSDGAGSARLSLYGADAAVCSVGSLLAEEFRAFIGNSNGVAVKQHILNTVLAALRAKADELGCEMHDLAATLLAVAADDENFLAVHIGDGVIGCYGLDGLKTLSAPDNGEFANATTFVTSRDALQRMRIYKGSAARLSGFVLMSDGTEQSLYHKRNRVLAPAVIRLMHRTSLIAHDVLLPQLAAALENVIAMQTQDDCSIALMARCSHALPPIRALSPTQRREVFGGVSLPLAVSLRICRKLGLRLAPCQIMRAMRGNTTLRQRDAQRFVKTTAMTRKKERDRIL